MTDRQFHFNLYGYGTLDVSADCLTSLRTLSQRKDGSLQFLFQFRREPGEAGAVSSTDTRAHRRADTRASGMFMVRLDIPEPYVSSAAILMDQLRNRFRIVDTEDAGQEDTVRRVPRDSSSWIASPVNTDSEDLHTEILDRIMTDTAS
ncbi:MULTISPECIES: hypothetical protein [unclassified Streptomyces]|uniref:hypothetical protein n=1 Tax=unclassified Streptomyces TaxID=2593676 RepID=UPI0011614F04|nr:hypothetical protein [Streptomyces sp. TSRI0281]